MVERPDRPGVVLVVKLGGLGVERPEARADLWRALGSLHLALTARRDGSGVIVVHGGGEAIARHLERLGMPTVKRDGIRLTPPEQMREIAGVLAGKVNAGLVGAMVAAGVPAVGLMLSSGGALRCEVTTKYGPDAGRVGEITGGDGSLIGTLLEAGYLPVFSSIGSAPDGELVNINADDAASGVARVARATGVVFLTDVPGVRGEAGTTLAELDGAEIERLIKAGVIEGGMVPKVRGALETARALGVPVLIASFDDPVALEGLASGERVGTRVVGGGAGRGALGAENKKSEVGS
ncbi:MAG: acetylglutamate kinase [Phycisphaerales bacterium]|nr:MAG: acetylglutamate kinase [Phycisphaerales bacterium]